MPEPTARQVEVLRAVVEIGTYKGAATALGLCHATVRNHMTDLRCRLGVMNTAQAVYILTARGVLVIPSVGRRLA